MIKDKTKAFITGGTGQVGTELIRRADAWKIDIVAPKRADMNIINEIQVNSQLDYIRPDIVINSAAFTAVDVAENDKDVAFRVNCDALKIMANSCKRLSIPLIHLSTDYVFDGTKTTSYDENDLTCPIGIYGKSKESGENAIREILIEHIILRTSWVYAAHGTNFVKTMLRIGKEREFLNVVDDQFGAPTFAGDIAEAILSITNQVLKKKDVDFWGTYHYTARGQATWKGFAEEIFDEKANWVSKKPSIIGIPSSQYPTPAKRPVNSVLNCSKVDAIFNPPRREWQLGLAEVLSELTEE
jgi:dTDP-4-dehydrorhamnose reductase